MGNSMTCGTVRERKEMLVCECGHVEGIHYRKYNSMTNSGVSYQEFLRKPCSTCQCGNFRQVAQVDAEAKL